MPRAHDSVRHEAVGIAKMARQAEPCPLGRIVGGKQTRGQVPSVFRTILDVLGQPSLGRAMTGLARHSVVELEPFAALRLDDIVSVTIETYLGLSGIPEAKVARNARRLFIEEDLIRTRVLVY